MGSRVVFTFCSKWNHSDRSVLVSDTKRQKERNEWVKGVKTSVFQTVTQSKLNKSKTNHPWLDLRRVEEDDHAHPGRKIEVESMFCTWCHHESTMP